MRGGSSLCQDLCSTGNKTGLQPISRLVEQVPLLFFQNIFQTIRTFLPLVAGRHQRKRTFNPKTFSNTKGFMVIVQKNTGWVFDMDPFRRENLPSLFGN